MPYAHLDLDYDKTYPGAYLTLPNSYYDPKKGAPLYHRYLDELELADRLGFDGVCVNEHHQTAYGMMPAPNLLAGALTRSVKRATICVLGRALPITDNPISIAEEFAMLDNLAEGRFIAGFVRGLGTEYHASMANPSFSHARFHEAHNLIVPGVDGDRPLRLRRQALPIPVRQSLAAPLPDAAPADLDSVAGLARDL